MALNILLIRESYDTVDGDAAAALLVGRGDTVTADNDAGNHDVSQFDVIVLANPGTLTPAQAGTTPVVTLGEDYVELDHCASQSTGNSTDIEVLNDEHPIAVAAGLTAGTLTIATSAGALSRANPGTLGAGAVAIAETTTSTTGRIVLYAFEQGAALASGDPAPARHVGFGYEPAGNLNATGQAILFACVDWAAGVLDGGGTSYTLTADPGAYTITGTDATLLYNRAVTAEAGSVALSGTDATLVYATTGSITGVVRIGGAPVEGAIVRLMDTDAPGYVGDTTTDASGVYSFAGLARAKKYHATVEYENGGTRYQAPSKPFLKPQ